MNMHAPLSERVVIIGAGVGGLVAAVMLAAQGYRVTVLEAAAAPGGKLRTVTVDDREIDAGPTVLTMRGVFDEIFSLAGEDIADHLNLVPAEILARHSWADGARLDLFADAERSAQAIDEFAGSREADGFRRFSAEAARIYRTLEAPFLRAQKTNPLGLTWRAGLRNYPGMLRIRAYSSMWLGVARHFRDPRLRQLFGRYTTYAGSSPFAAPGTLMLIAHVEAVGVWLVEGGMHRLAAALAALAEARGAEFRYASQAGEILLENGRAAGVRLAGGETVRADHVICNADPAALAGGLLGEAAKRAVHPLPRRARSLSAFCLQAAAPTAGFPLVRHNVFFSDDYPAEFAALKAGRMPAAPTLYVAAQDRGAAPGETHEGRERLLVVANAPANADTHPPTPEETDRCKAHLIAALERHGLRIDAPPEEIAVSTPAEFDRRFPGAGGAIYGRASHGWAASFLRPGSRTRIPGLWLAGGSTHPGAGVPMAALSGRLAAEALMADRVSTRPWSRAAMPGGTSMR